MHKAPELSTDMIEGREAFERFDATMKSLANVPRAEMLKREKAYKRQSLKNPSRRGPKPKHAKVRGLA